MFGLVASEVGRLAAFAFVLRDARNDAVARCLYWAGSAFAVLHVIEGAVSLSYATRIGVLSAATAAGAAALPAALAAGAVTGLVVGSVRFYRDYKKGGYDLSDAEGRRKFRNQLLMSTALSTVGGGMGYAFVNHYEQIAGFVQQTGVPAWISRNMTMLAESQIGVAAAGMMTGVKTAVAEAYNGMPSVSTMMTNAKVFVGRVYEGAASFVKETYSRLPTASAVIEGAKKTVKGWWRSAMNAIGVAQETQIAKAPMPVATDAQARAEFSALIAPEYLPQLAHSFETHSWSDYVLTSGIPQGNISSTFPATHFSLQPLKDTFSNFVEGEIVAEPAARIVSETTASLDLQAASEPDVALSTPAPVPMKDQIASYFDGHDLSRRAARIVEKAMSGDLQAQKDLAMNMLNGHGGFAKDPAMAMKLYDNVIAEGFVEGARPRGAVFQAMMDKAWVQFHGKGVPADTAAAMVTMRELAKFNSGARAMLAEWSGEKVRNIAAATKHVVAPVKDVAGVKAAKGLSCNWLKVGQKIVSGACASKGDIGLNIGDRISLNPR